MNNSGIFGKQPKFCNIRTEHGTKADKIDINYLKVV